MKQSTLVDHSEYKDIVHEMIDWKRFINFIERGNTTQLGILITDTRIRLTQVRDDRGFTLLHHAVLKMKPDIVKFLIEYAFKKQDEDEDILQDWINAKTNKEKFTALHFAAFKGCLRSCYNLIDYGANLKLLNANGLTMLHLAAQGDSANTLYYFITMNLDVNK